MTRLGGEARKSTGVVTVERSVRASAPARRQRESLPKWCLHIMKSSGGGGHAALGDMFPMVTEVDPRKRRVASIALKIKCSTRAASAWNHGRK